ncbi:hypothetical protein H6F89_30430 [Cyanobacteria bacterium FACHB-63]|nr:hypothetical protein [Cyanobacteria bacterium FACHB-63]
MPEQDVFLKIRISSEKRKKLINHYRSQTSKLLRLEVDRLIQIAEAEREQQATTKR